MPRNMVLSHGRTLDFGRAPLVMGILNSTPDSFHAESRVGSGARALEVARRMIACGADILDIGGESTRPGSERVDLDEELSRTVPLIRAIRAESDIPISIDTQKAGVAQAALREGADIINDVSALTADSGMLDVAISEEAVVVLMHMQGTPRTMQDNPQYEDPVREILFYLSERSREVKRAGVDAQRIIVDPGIGFGKRTTDNLRLIADLPAFSALGFPVLLGASRKSFIGTIIGGDKPVPTGRRLHGSIAVHVIGALKGADILRVHDVEETVDALAICRAVVDASADESKGVGLSAAGT